MDPTSTPAPFSPTDPNTEGPARPRLWLAALALLLIGTVWFMQRPAPENSAEAQDAKVGLNVKAPTSDPLIMIGKLVLAWGEVPEFQGALRSQVDGSGLGGGEPAWDVREAMLLIAAGEADAPGAPAGAFMAPKPRSISERLDAAATACDPASPLLEDIGVAKSILSAMSDAPEGTARRAAAAAAIKDLTATQTAALQTRHGWFAEALLAAGDPGSAVIAQAKRQSTVFLTFAVIVGCLMLLALLAGFGLLITALVLLVKGRLRSKFVRPPPLADDQPAWAAHVWLETVCIFAGGFLAIKLALLALHEFDAPAQAMTVVALGGNWLLATAIFWPVVRGMNWRTWRERIGWRANRPGPAGVAAEVGCGVLGYFCALPVMIVTVILAFVVGLIFKALTGQEPISPRQINKVEELLSTGNIWITIIVVLLAVIWAPIVEESIFRGALYRHLRRRRSVVLAGLITALAFAAMHPYALLQMVVVGALGLVFAMIREWRGSIIPCATAHFIQNAVAVSAISVLGPLMRG